MNGQGDQCQTDEGSADAGAGPNLMAPQKIQSQRKDDDALHHQRGMVVASMDDRPGQRKPHRNEQGEQTFSTQSTHQQGCRHGLTHKYQAHPQAEIMKVLWKQTGKQRQQQFKGQCRQRNAVGQRNADAVRMVEP